MMLSASSAVCTDSIYHDAPRRLEIAVALRVARRNAGGTSCWRRDAEELELRWSWSCSLGDDSEGTAIMTSPAGVRSSGLM